jgi:glycerol-3-phosphate dehydrogenase
MAEGDSNEVLKGFLEERWRGIRPVLWGTALKEEELLESIYKGIFNLQGFKGSRGQGSK